MAVLSCLEMRCIEFCLVSIRFSNFQLGLWFGAGNGLRIITDNGDKMHTATWCENCIVIVLDSATVPQNAEGTVRRPFKQDPAADQVPQHQLSHVYQCWTANCGLETGSRLVYKRVHTADGTRQHCSVSNILRTTENCLDLSPIQFTPPTRTKQDSEIHRSASLWNSVFTNFRDAHTYARTETRKRDASSS